MSISDTYRENVIEWITGDDTVTLTLTQPKYKNLVKRLVDGGKVGGDYIVNPDGIMLAHLPLEVLRLNKRREVNLTEEQLRIRRERLSNGRRS